MSRGRPRGRTPGILGPAADVESEYGMMFAWIVAMVAPMSILARFRRRPASLVGIDIGSSAVKAVELIPCSGGRKVARVGVRPVPPESIVEGMLVGRDGVADAVRGVLESGRIRGREVALSLPGNAIVAREITMPRMSPGELAGSIAWEAERHIPFDLHDVNLDYQVVGHGKDADGTPTMAVLLAAARKATIADYAAAVAQAGCVPVVVDVAAFALQNAYALGGGLEDGRSVALLDAGASTTNVNIVRSGRSVLTRDIPAGGNAYTDALRSAHALSFDQAERLKRGGADGEELEDREPAVREVTERLLLEVEKTFDFFTASRASDRLDRIVLSGGGSRGPGLAAAMTRRFGVRLERFDPFRSMSLDEASDGDGDPADAAATAGVATGLALRRAGDR